MLKKLIESTKTTKEQKIAMNALMAVAGVTSINWIEYNEDKSINIQIENIYYGMPGNYRITKKGETEKL